MAYRDAAVTAATQLYQAIMWEVRKHIFELGITMEQVDKVSGIPERYMGKILHPEESSGRQATWRTLQDVIDGIYPGGINLRIRPCAGMSEIKASINRKLERHTEMLSGLSTIEKTRPKRNIGSIAIRDFAREAGQRGNRARNEKMPAWKRRSIARRAARSRWRRVRRERKDRRATPHPAPSAPARS